MRFESAGCSEQGKRKSQQDAWGADDEAGVFVVADGVGGHPNGAEASVAAVKALVCKEWKTRSPEGLFLEARESVAASGGSTTAVVLSLFSDDYPSAGRGTGYVSWVGDSRLYRLRDRVLEQVTTDHRVGRHTLTRWLGDDDSGPPDFRMVHIQAGDVFLLATDGVSDTLPPEVTEKWLRAVASGEDSAEAAASALVFGAIAIGSTDNCTALVVRVLE